MKAIINIVTALQCEAKALIEHYQLKKIIDSTLPFSIFMNKEKSIYLIICGVGKIKAAVATTFLQTWHKQTGSSFLNIGIAGSTQFSINTGVVAHKIVDQSTQRSWYPFANPLNKLNQGVLLTCDTPQLNYPAIGMVDMEAYAYFQAANYFVTQEQIQVFKVVSDNNELSQHKLNENQVNKLITDNLESVDLILNYLLNLSQEANISEQASENLDMFLSHWHFTHAQLIQLKEMLRRWKQQITSENPFLICKNEKNASLVLNKLLEKLDSYANCLH